LEGEAMKWFKRILSGPAALALPRDAVGLALPSPSTIRPQGHGVRVGRSNEGDIGADPASRWFALFTHRRAGPDFEDGLVHLKRRAEAS
jgi:hypothetical protein